MRTGPEASTPCPGEDAQSLPSSRPGTFGSPPASRPPAPRSHGPLRDAHSPRAGLRGTGTREGGAPLGFHHSGRAWLVPLAWRKVYTSLIHRASALFWSRSRRCADAGPMRHSTTTAAAFLVSPWSLHRCGCSVLQRRCPPSTATRCGDHIFATGATAHGRASPNLARPHQDRLWTGRPFGEAVRRTPARLGPLTSGQNQFKHHLGTTYVAEEDGRILGFATVSAAQIEVQDLPASKQGRLLRYPLPVLRLADWPSTRTHKVEVSDSPSSGPSSFSLVPWPVTSAVSAFWWMRNHRLSRFISGTASSNWKFSKDNWVTGRSLRRCFWRLGRFLPTRSDRTSRGVQPSSQRPPTSRCC